MSVEMIDGLPLVTFKCPSESQFAVLQYVSFALSFTSDIFGTPPLPRPFPWITISRGLFQSSLLNGSDGPSSIQDLPITQHHNRPKNRSNTPLHNRHILHSIGLSPSIIRQTVFPSNHIRPDNHALQPYSSIRCRNSDLCTHLTTLVS
jgi:hypothetical protein